MSWTPLTAQQTPKVTDALKPHCLVQAGKHAGERGYCLAPKTAELCEGRAEDAGNYAACHAELMRVRQQRDHADGRAAEAQVVRAEQQVRIETLVRQNERKDQINAELRERLSGTLSPWARAAIVAGAGLLGGSASAALRGDVPDLWDGLVAVGSAAAAELVISWAW